MDPSIVVASKVEREIPADAVKGLYDSEPWWPERSVDAIARVLARYPAVGAWDGPRLVGFARAFTDGSFRAQIEDVLVLDGYRRRGIGRALVGRLLEELEHVDAVTLFCNRRLARYYEHLGFTEFAKLAVMHRKRSE